MKFRALIADDVEVRIATVKKSGVSLLLYKDARVDMDMLDETVGPYGWKREHQFKDGKLYCTVSIWDNDKQNWDKLSYKHCILDGKSSWFLIVLGKSRS